MIDKIEELLISNWSLLYNGYPIPKQLDFVILSRSQVVIFIFNRDDHKSQPIGVVKICRTPKENSWIEKSVNRVTKIRESLCDPLAKTVPNIISLGFLDGLFCSAETFLPGKQIRVAAFNSNNKRIRKDVRSVLSWLTDFQQQTTIGSLHLDSPTVEKIVIEPLLAYLDQGECNKYTQKEIIEFFNPLIGCFINLGWRYGDANPTNFLLQKDEVSGAIDWGSCRDDSWPIFDWCDFIFQYILLSYQIKTRRWFINFEDIKQVIDLLFDVQSNYISQILHINTMAYLQYQGIDGYAWPAIFAAFLLTLIHTWDPIPLVCYSIPRLMELKTNMKKNFP